MYHPLLGAYHYEKFRCTFESDDKINLNQFSTLVSGYGADCPVKKLKKLPSKIELKPDMKDQVKMPPIQFSSEISEKPESPKTGTE